jgi:hypothetical protein
MKQVAGDAQQVHAVVCVLTYGHEFVQDDVRRELLSIIIGIAYQVS